MEIGDKGRRFCLAGLIQLAACSTSGNSTDGAADGQAAAENQACLAANDNDPSSAGTYVAANLVATGFDTNPVEFVYLVVRQDSGSVFSTSLRVPVGGSFGGPITRALKRNVAGEILWMVQRNYTEFCDPANGDHAGYLHVDAADPPGSDAVKISLTDNQVTSTPRDGVLCDPQRPFAGMVPMDISGTGFADEGKVVRFYTVLANGITAGAGRTGVGDGKVSIPLTYDENTNQEIYWFVDRDDDQVCTNGIDHPGYVKTTPFRPAGREPFEVSITDNQIETTPRGVDVCAVMNACASRL